MTFEFDAKKYKKASAHQRQWAKTGDSGPVEKPLGFSMDFVCGVLQMGANLLE